MPKHGLQTFVFRDVYNASGVGKAHLKIVLVRAKDEDEAWEKFSKKYAIGNFGLRADSTVQDVKEYFKGPYGMEVYSPDETLELE